MWGYKFILHRFKLNEKGDMWEPELAIDVEGFLYLDDYDLRKDALYGYVVEDETGSRSDLRAIKYSGVDIAARP